MLKLDIYGLKIQIKCKYSKTEKDLTLLLRHFIKNNLEDVHIKIDLKEKVLPRAIGEDIFPHLAEKKIWGIHAGGIHYNGGHLVLGPSQCGKSTLCYTAMKKGFDIVSDDITLLKESGNTIEMLPLYAGIFLKNKKIGMETNSLNIKIDKFIDHLKPEIFCRLLRSIIFLPQLFTHIIFNKKTGFITDPDNFKKTNIKYIICPIRYKGNSYVEKSLFI